MTKLVVPLSYWLLILLWSVVLALYISKLRRLSSTSRGIAVLLTILSIDAFRTLFESTYFGLYFNAQFGFLPKAIFTTLGRPELLAIPKIINIITGVIVLALLIRRWLPKEVQAEQELAQALAISKERMQLALDGAALGTWDWNLVEDSTTFDERFCAMVGFNDSELGNYRDHGRLFVHPEDLEGQQCRLKAHVEGDAPHYESEHRIRTKSGDWLWVLDKGKVIQRGSSGEAQRACGTYLDISDRKAIEAQRLRRVRRLEHVAQLDEAIYRSDSASDLITGAVKAILPLFEAHRVWLIETPDSGGLSPAAPTMHAHDEHSISPEAAWSPKTRLALEVLLRQTLDAEVALRVGPQGDAALPGHLSTELAVKSQLMMGLKSRHGETGVLVVQDCCEARVWAPEDLETISDVARRICDGLGSLNALLRLKKSEARLHSVFDQATDSIVEFELSPEGDPKIQDCNLAAARLFGRTRDELIGTLAHELDLDRSAQEYRELSQSALQRQLPIFETKHRHKDGSTVEVETSLKAIRTPGHPPILLALGRDTTERHAAEAERMMLMAAIEQAAETIVITDATGRMQYVNPAFEKITGYTREEAIGENSRILKSGVHGQRFYKDFWQTLLRRETWNGHIINQRKDGTTYREDATISPVCDAAGRITNYVAVKRDMTQVAKLEDQLRQSQKMEAVGLLAGGVAHDFNNILQVINGYSTLAEDYIEEDHPAHECVTEVLQAGERAAKLVSQLLAFSRRQVLDLSPVDLGEVMRDVTKMIQRVIGDHIQLIVDAAPRLSQVRADPGQIQQVLVNLCINARDAMPKGGTITITAVNRHITQQESKLHAWAEPGDFVLMTISDTGIGMDASTLKNIFEPFFTTKEVGHGTGLGLSTAYGIVKQHGGGMNVLSVPGKGTDFELYLPVMDAPSGAHRLPA